jgi:hypothetical protein
LTYSAGVSLTATIAVSIRVDARRMPRWFTSEPLKRLNAEHLKKSATPRGHASQLGLLGFFPVIPFLKLAITFSESLNSEVDFSSGAFPEELPS